MSITKDPTLELTTQEATRRAREDEEFLSNLLVANHNNPDPIEVDKEKLRHIYGTLNRIEHVARLLDYELDKKYKLINAMEDIYQEEMKKRQ